MIVLSNKYIYTLILFVTCVTLLFINQIYLLFLFPILLFFLISNSKAIIVTTMFVALVTITSGFGETQRFVIQYLSVIGLSILFIKNYGISFTKFPRLPSRVTFLIAFIIFTFLFSLLFTSYFVVGFEQFVRSISFLLLVYLFYSLIIDGSDIRYYLYALYMGAIVYLIQLVFEIVRADFNIINLNQNFLLEEGVSFIHRNAIGGFFSICIAISTAFLVTAFISKK